MKDNYEFPPISITSDLKPPFPFSLKKKKKAERTVSDKIQPSSNNSKASVDNAKNLEPFFNQEAIVKRSITTYSKPRYFPHTQQLDFSHPELIRERFKDETTPVASPKLIFGAKFQLETKGSLKQTPDGLVYLDISDDFIHKLYPLLRTNGTQKPYYSAHIPIISEKERSTLDEIKEIGEVFTFSPKDCECLTLREHPDVESVWVLTVESQALEHLREKYRLPSKLHSQEFAIVLAIKPRKTPLMSKEQDLYYFKINPATSYA